MTTDSEAGIEFSEQEIFPAGNKENDPAAVPGSGSGPQSDAWSELRQFTAARIALGSTGVSVPMKEVLQFRLAHAHARDAVFSQIDEKYLAENLRRWSLPVLLLKSRAKDRSEYLQRPDLGRTLDAASASLVNEQARLSGDISLVIADGLSAEAVNRHALPLLALLLPAFGKQSLTLTPVSIVTQGRVAVGDGIGEGLAAKISLLMIGERPGLSSPDSLGVYLTYAPRRGLTDESRNCISNIRPEGLDYYTAAGKILYLIAEALRRQLSGVALKDEAPRLPEGTFSPDTSGRKGQNGE